MPAESADDYFKANFPYKYLSPRTKSKDTVVAIIDDEHSITGGLQYGLTERGYETVGFFVDRDAMVPDEYMGLLAQYVANTGAQGAVVDKGLGYTSGIELIKALRELGLLTIMLTGEPGTRETHRVAHRYVEKAEPTKKIYDAVTALMS